MSRIKATMDALAAQGISRALLITGRTLATQTGLVDREIHQHRQVGFKHFHALPGQVEDHVDVQRREDAVRCRQPLADLGEVDFQRAIRDQLVRMWPPVKGQTVAGFGFAVPLLRPYLEDARRVIGLMPGPQGVMPWPAGLANVSVLCEETQWPLPTGHVDRLVLMHGLETSDNPTAVLEEAHRVLGPGGRIVIVVPNRAGLWARRDATPFGQGRPYSVRQLEGQLKEHGFRVERSMTLTPWPTSVATIPSALPAGASPAAITSGGIPPGHVDDAGKV